MILTIGYTGLRWGEAIGLEPDYLRPGEIHVEWQLRELNGRFHRLPPKDDSYRSPAWEPCLPVNLPPFLTGLLDPPDPAPRASALRLRRPARRQRPVRLPRPRRRPLPAQQLRPPRLPPRLRRPPRSQRAAALLSSSSPTPPPGPAPRRRLATRRPISGLRSAARPGHPGHPRRHTARLLAADQAGPDRARAQARAQDLDGGGGHPRDPRRAAPRPPGPRHARPLRPRQRPHARRPQARTPGPVGRLPTRPRGHQPALTRPTARRAADSRGDPPESGDTGGQGEDDLPKSSQPPQAARASHPRDTGRTGINSI